MNTLNTLSSGERMQPSTFVNLKDTSPKPITWTAIVERIKSDPVVRANTQMCRDLRLKGDDKSADKYKRLSGAFSPCVQCNGGHGSKNVVGYTGYAMADFDHIPAERMEAVKDRVCKSSFTFIAYITSSGYGLRIIYPYRIDGEHAEWEDVFLAGNEHYARLVGQPFDHQVSDPTRLSFYTHDAEIYFNTTAIAMPVHPADVFDKAVREVEKSGEVRYVEGSRNNYIMRIGYLLNRWGVPETEAADWASRRFTDYPHPEDVIHSCYNQTQQHATRPQPATQRSVGRPRTYASLEEIEQYLHTQAEFRRNTATGDIEFRPLPECCIPAANLDLNPEGYALLTDVDANEFYRNIGRDNLPARSVDDFWRIFHSYFSTPFDPFRSYFEALPEWHADTDPDYIAQLAATIRTNAPGDLFERSLRKWLVGMVACLLTDAANDNILALIGRPGIGKTSFFQRLLPEQWQREYFCIKHDNSFADKDARIQLTRNVLVCMEETDTLRRKDNTQLKSVSTDRYLHVRIPYERGDSVLRHCASLCATGNDVEILTDPTGNRRWLIFEVTDMDNPYTYTLPYEGLYAQIYALWKSGFRYYCEPSEIAELDSYRQQFEAPSLEEELVSTWIRHPEPGKPYEFLNASAIIGWLNSDEVGNRNHLNPVTIGRALRKLGFEKKSVGTAKGYRVVRLSPEEVKERQQNDGQFHQEQLPF